MIAIDTNIVVRILVKDDPAQVARSQRLFEENDTFIPDTVILETYWVLKSRYLLSSAEILASIRGLVGLPNVFVRDSNVIELLLDWYERGMDFPDAFHLASSTGATGFVTFDRNFAKRAQAVSDRTVTLLT